MNVHYEELAEGKFLRLVRMNGWEFVERSNCRAVVAVLPITDDGKAVLIEQYRTPFGRDVVELPAGLVGDQPGEEDEQIEIAGAREMFEETGYEAGELRFLTKGPSSAGMTTEMIHFFLATKIKKTGEGGGLQNERIRMHEVPLTEVKVWLQKKVSQGTLVDPKIFTALYFLDSE